MPCLEWQPHCSQARLKLLLCDKCRQEKTHCRLPRAACQACLTVVKMQHLCCRARVPEACCLCLTCCLCGCRPSGWPTSGEGQLLASAKVHRGFQAAWRNNSLHDRVIDRIKEIINSGYIVTKGLRFHVTGVPPAPPPPPPSFRLLIRACCCPRHRTGPA